MNEKHFLYVRTLAEERSFSRAAEALGISQPSLSQSIRKIEQDAGTELFDRSGAEIRLTDAGRVYLESAQQILDIERRMKSAFADFAGRLEQHHSMDRGVLAERCKQYHIMSDEQASNTEEVLG